MTNYSETAFFAEEIKNKTKVIFRTSALLWLLFYAISSNAQEQVFINDYELEAFKERTLEKVTELGNYIVTITDKEVDEQLRNMTIEIAIGLFENEDKVVEVASLNRDDIFQIPIRSYLNRIKILSYSKINITWYDISYMSDFVRDPNGNYKAVVTIFQKFEGYRDGKLVYADVTQKNVEVTLSKIVEEFDNKVVEQWQVLLGNISVFEIKKS